MNFRLIGLSLAIAALAVTGLDAKTVTRPCKKNLSTGQLIYELPGVSSDYIIEEKGFKQKSSDGRFAYGTCTINLKYQPPD
jgi:hypothetical protein